MKKIDYFFNNYVLIIVKKLIIKQFSLNRVEPSRIKLNNILIILKWRVSR